MKPSILIVSWRTGADYAGSEIFWTQFILSYSQKYRFGLFFPQPAKELYLLNQLKKLDTRLYLQNRLPAHYEQAIPQPYHLALDYAVQDLVPDLIWVNLNSQFPHNFLAVYPWLKRVPRIIMVQAVVPQLKTDGRDMVSIQHFYKTAKFATFCTERNRFDAEVALKIPLNNSLVIGNFVNAEEYSPMPHKPEKERWKISCVARYETQAKGQQILLKALASEELINLPWQLNLVGAGPDEIQLKKLADDLGIKDRIAFFETSNVRQTLNRTDLFVLPSNWEGLSFALLEAMACSVPCAVSEVAGQDAVVMDAECGWTFKPNDLESLVKSLGEAYRHREKYSDLGQNGRNYVINNYSREQILNSMNKAILSMI